MKELSKVKTYSPPADSKLSLPEPTDSHFFTAGRAISFWPKINANGYTLFKEDVSPSLVQTLVCSTTDLDHIKLGYGATSNEVTGTNNSTMGAIHQAELLDDGIDVVCKLERELVHALGYAPEDFEPGKGIFSSYSQESDFRADEGKYIVVDKADPTKILRTLSYKEGVALGFADKSGKPLVSQQDITGKWHYKEFSGGNVFYAFKPVSFCGVGHVAHPADDTALIYKLAASRELAGMDLQYADLNPSPEFYKKHGVKGSDGQYHLPLPPKGHPDAKRYARAVLTRAHQVTKLTPEQVASQVRKAKEILGESSKALSDWYPGMDQSGNPGNEMTQLFAGMQNTFDNNIWGGDIMSHPDILTSDGEFSQEDDGDEPDDHYVCCYSDADYANKADGNPLIVKHKLFKIKDAKGKLDRPRLISAYRTLMGTRGDIHKLESIPDKVRMHALARVRQGLNETIPTIKETSSVHMTTEEELQALDAKIEEMKTAKKLVSYADFQAVETKAATAEQEIAALKEKVTLLTSSLTEKETELGEIKAKELSSARIAELEAVLPFTEDEKKADTHVEYVKSLASFDDSRFEVEKLKRENLALKKANSSVQKSLSSHKITLVQDPTPGTAAGFSWGELLEGGTK